MGDLGEEEHNGPPSLASYRLSSAADPREEEQDGLGSEGSGVGTGMSSGLPSVTHQLDAVKWSNARRR
jgi:hypothetical protein